MEGDRRKDDAQRDRIEEMQEEYRRYAQRNLDAIIEGRHRTKWVLTILSALLLALGAWSVAFQVQQSDTAGQASRAAKQAATAAKQADAAARQANMVAVQAQGFAESVQASRLDLIRSECEDQNRRHDNTIKTLHRVADSTPPQQGQTKAQQKRNVAAFVFIIDAETPHQDCNRIVAKAKLKKPT